ncbi:hypothetical protein CCR75_003670 [Bremia lactucae]|uniref:Chorein N-terminal domain-containing protein n=1 Tax=Bremia lactucae TaxID=4779 RepID=A0A976IIT5_BRELC|nr:hypothetical protein CCR75_003670 [Bremia lactucae]
MLDLLSPLRGYIAQNLQFYLGKYIEGIQLEGLGLFGGDLVLNDLEIKRHVLRESLEIPSSFDFSRGFIRELRIHIPWTQLLSQPIEVKFYTIELILTARSSTATPVSVGDSVAIETEIDQPKSGWIHDTLQKILANVSIQVNNLVLKYEHDDIVFSIALGALDFYSASEKNGWKRAFEELKTGRRIVCKGMDAKDVTIFLDRYTSEKNANKLTSQYSFRRKVVGYEVPILSRTSASMRAKVQLFSKAAVSGPLDQRSNPNSPLRQHHPDVNNCRKSIDLDKSFMHKPSVMYDPFYYYSCYRSSLSPVYEVDIFIGELVFSISDRQLEMLNQLLRSASYKLLQTHNSSSKIHNCGNNDDKPTAAGNTSAGPTFNYQMEAQEVNSNANKHVSWLSWVINALGTADNEQEDTLVTELLAETRAALLRGVSPGSKTGNDDYMSTTKTSCMRVFISSAILTLRKHEAGEHVENKDCMTTESREEFVPVANLGMVKVSVNARKNKIARPAVPILHSKLTYVVLELLLAREQERCGTNLVFEIEKVETMSATTSDNMDSVKYKKEEMLLTWGTTDNRCFYDCVSHPYFINSFFDEETVRLCERENRSLKTVKGRQNADIPVWKSLKADRKRKSSFDFANAQCECSMTWNGQTVRCIPVSTISEICQNLISSLKTKEQLLDNVILLNAASKAWALAGFATSFSQTFARALTAAAFEYQTHRNPGVGAQENLTQLLLPQLIAISCRYMLHHCPAASLSPSDKSDCWRRSIYSALRMRSAYIYDINESHVALPDLQRNNETVSNVLDVSFGAAQAVVDPAKCLIILESLSIFLPKNKNDLNNSIWICNEMSTPALKSVMPPKKSRNDVKLITGYYVHIRLPSSAGSGDTSVKIDACSDLNVSGSDFTWLGNFRTDSSDSRLQLGTLTAYLGGAQSKIAKVSLLELLEFDLSTLENCVDEGDSNEFLASLIKAKIDFSLPAIENITTSINRIARPLGYPIPWANTIFVPKQPQALFQIEICQISFSRIVISRPRLLMAQRQSFRGEISSVSATWKNKVEGSYKMILQGGAAAMPYKNSNVNSHLVQFEMVQEKSSGRLNGVPLLKSLGRFALISDLLTTTCAHCKVSVQGQLAHVHIDLCGLTQLTRKVCYLINTIIPSRDDLKYKLVRQEHCTQDDTIADRSLTGWNFTIDLKAGGADIRLNEALQLGILVLTLSSTENKADATDSVKSGGTLHLDFVSKGAVLYASKSGILMGLTDPLILNIDKVNVSAGFTHRLVNGQQTYATDVTLSASSMQASLSRLKVQSHACHLYNLSSKIPRNVNCCFY